MISLVMIIHSHPILTIISLKNWLKPTICPRICPYHCLKTIVRMGSLHYIHIIITVIIIIINRSIIYTWLSLWLHDCRYLLLWLYNVIIYMYVMMTIVYYYKSVIYQTIHNYSFLYIYIIVSVYIVLILFSFYPLVN